jgi:hypothetical protein
MDVLLRQLDLTTARRRGLTIEGDPTAVQRIARADEPSLSDSARVR